jgi:exodeoxyribonuclease III
VPHGRALDHWHFQYKLDFLDALTANLAGWLDEGHVVLGGDVNVAATDSDVFHPDAFEGRTHVSPQERAALTRLYGAGLVDIDADVWGGRARRFTWWDHGIGYSRNLGMRLNHLAADPALAARVDTTWIDHIERGADRPSDHAALLADFRLRETTALATTRGVSTTQHSATRPTGGHAIPEAHRTHSRVTCRDRR